MRNERIGIMQTQLRKVIGAAVGLAVVSAPFQLQLRADWSGMGQLQGAIPPVNRQFRLERSTGVAVEPCAEQLLLTRSRGPAATQAAAAGRAAAAAILQKQEAVEWQRVQAAEQTEVAALHAAIIAAMKAGHANAVVAAHNLLITVQDRLAQEKIQPPFPMFFQVSGATFNLPPEEAGVEMARNKAVAAAVARWHEDEAAFQAALAQADRQKVARLRASIKAAMKAGHANAVVAAMAELRAAQQQLQQDSPAGSPAVLNRPVFFGGQPGVAGGSGRARGGLGVETNGGATNPAGGAGGGPALPARRDWPKMVREADKPVAAGSVFSLGAALQNDPHQVVGGRVIWHLGTGMGLALSTQQRREWRRLRQEIRQHFQAIRRAAARRDVAEYQYQLGLLEQANPNATMWQVAWPIKHAEQIEHTKVARLAKKEEHADIQALAKCFRLARLRVRLVGLKGVAVPTSGPIYGVILAARSVVVNRETPALTLPSGVSLRAQALGPMAVLQFVPFPDAGPFLSGVPELMIPAMPIGTARVKQLTILYCGPYPRYRSSTGGNKPGHGYVFILKNGSQLRAASYTTGQSYYHAVWDGVAMPIAKNLVVKIKPE